MQSRDYTATIKAIEKHGYTVKFIPIKWARTTIEHWTAELDSIYATYNPKDTILAGFSYGSVTAFMSATKRNPSELWLFSLSPYFSEDIKSKHMKQTWLKAIGHRRVMAFSQLDFKELAKSITCEVLLFVGQQEIAQFPMIGNRATIAHQLLKHNKLFIIEGVGHDVANEHYIAAIEKAI